MSKAEVMIDGYVAKDPELRKVGQGKSVLQVSVPYQRSKRNDQGGWDRVGDTTWWEATFWEAEAETLAGLIRKGTRVLLTGLPEVSMYQKQDGSAGIRAQVLYPVIGLIPKPRQGGQQQQQPAADAVWGRPAAAPMSQGYGPGQNAATMPAAGGGWSTATPGADEVPF